MNKNTFKTTILLAGIGGLLVTVGSVLGGRGGAVIGLLFGFGIVGWSYWNSDKLAIRAARAVPVTEAQAPEFYRMMRDLTSKAGMPMPKLYMTPDEQPNAFATGRNPDHAAVAVTQGIVRILGWGPELQGVLAHEISHVGNRDILIGSVAAAIATAISFIANMAMWGAMFGGGRGDDDNGPNPLVLLLAAIVAPIAAGLLQMALSRSREFEADRSGARLVGDGEALARALEAIQQSAERIPMPVQPAQASMYIINPLTNAAVAKRVQFANLFTTHPPTAERTRRLRAGEWRR